MSFGHWLRRVFDRKRYERELDEELAFHVDCRRETLIAEGVDPAEATRRARVELGMSGLHRDAVRSAHGLAFVDAWLGDLKRAARGLAASPGYVITSVAILGVAIGVNLLLHSVWQNYMANPPPTTKPGVLFDLAVRGSDAGEVPPLTRDELEAVTQALSGGHIGVAWSRQNNRVLTTRTARTTYGAAVSASYPLLLQSTPILGRTLAPDDFRSGATSVVLGGRLWRQLTTEGIELGDNILLDGTSFTIVGVMPDDFAGLEPFPPQFLISDVADAALRRAEGRSDPARFSTTLQFPPDAAPEQATALAARLSTLLTALAGRPDRDTRIARVRLIERRSQLSANESEGIHTVILPVLALTLMLLVAACANLGNLMLARATMRRQELAIRASLGASRWQLLRLLMMESLLLALMAAVFGLVSCALLAEPIHRFGMSMLIELGIEPLRMHFRPALIGWALLQALVACLAFGLLPALAVTGNDLANATRRDGALFQGRIRASTLRAALMSAQVAVSLMLLLAAALIIDMTRRGDGLDLGIPVDSVFDVRHPAPDDAFRQRLLTLPGVISVSATANVPLYGSPPRSPVRVDGRAEQLAFHRVDERHFDTMALSPLLGRVFRQDEAAFRADVAVISQATATALWPGAPPLGKSITLIGDDGSERRVEVIGVVRDVVSGLLFQGVDRSAVYLPGALGQDGMTNLMVRVDRAHIESSREAMARACLDAAVARPCTPWTLGELIAVYRLPLAVASGLAAGLGFIALAISAVGLFGVVRFQVAARTREFGVRMALGARPREVMTLVLRQAIRHVRTGMIIGLLGSLALSSVLAALFGPAQAFPLIGYIGVPLLLLLVTLAAAAVPARRAVRIEVTEALRES